MTGARDRARASGQWGHTGESRGRGALANRGTEEGAGDGKRGDDVEGVLETVRGDFEHGVGGGHHVARARACVSDLYLALGLFS